MSYFFDGVDDSLSLAAAVRTAAPLTMACWFNSTDATLTQILMALGVSASTDNRFVLQAAGAVAGDPIRASTRTTSNADASTTSGYSTGVWQHACGVFASATDRRAFLNGGGKGTNATSLTPAGINATRIGTSLTTTSPTAGRIAEAAIWSVALSDAEVALLAKGVPPADIQRAALVGYWPLRLDANDKVSTNNFTVNQAVLGEPEPPMMRPKLILPSLQAAQRAAVM